MVELAATVFISVGSGILWGYWFRYTCLLILTAKTPHDYSWDCAETNGLGFVQIPSKVWAQASLNFDQLQKCLDRDYNVVTYLLKHTAPSYGESVFEYLILALYYRLLRAVCLLSRRVSTPIASDAIEQMRLVVTYFANAMGKRAACASNA